MRKESSLPQKWAAIMHVAIGETEGVTDGISIPHEHREPAVLLGSSVSFSLDLRNPRAKRR